MADIGAHLSQYKWIPRSGAALGADAAFESGHRRLDAEGSRCEIFVPIAGYNGHDSKLLPTAAAFELAKRFVYRFDRRSAFAKAANARNMMQILGAGLEDPVDFVICWTEGGKIAGGTGSALRCAEAYNIPILNLGEPRREVRPAPVLSWIAQLL
jgi:hypothetical protein